MSDQKTLDENQKKADLEKVEIKIQITAKLYREIIQVCQQIEMNSSTFFKNAIENYLKTITK